MSETKDLDEGNRHTAAAKARPETWDQLVGQPRAIEVLTRILRGQRETPGYLLSGPTGTGKTSAACLLGIAMSCEHRAMDDVDSCERCREQIKALDPRRAHVLSFTTLTCSDSDIDKQVQKLIESGDLSEGRGYLDLSPIVVLLDEAQDLPKKTQRRLLSELESPDARGGVVLLATNEPEELMPALRDRCTDAPFVGLGRDSLRMIAERHCAAFGYRLDDEALAEVVFEADEGGRNLAKLLRERALYQSASSRMPLIAEFIHGVVSEDLSAASIALDTLQDRAQFDPGFILKSLATVWHGALVRKLNDEAPWHFYDRFREPQALLLERSGDRLRREVSLIAEITNRETARTRTRLTVDAVVAELLFRDDLDTKLGRIEAKLSQLLAAAS